MTRWAAVSVDVDPLRCYHAIHGLPEVPARARDLVFQRAVPRFVDLFARHGVAATFFIVGSDLQSPELRSMARDLVRAGHELGNHSETHPYDLVARAPTAMHGEIARTHDRLGELLGHAPAGFRAPGYNVTPGLFAALAEHGYRYDSSMFPSPPYYLAKVGVMAQLRLRGQQSRSYIGDPRQLAAPADPYQASVSAPWDEARDGAPSLCELPITVTPLVRLPVIGTTLLMAPRPLRRALLWSTLGRPLFNLELHGIELLDAVQDDVPAELVRRHPDLGRTLAQKWEALDDVLGWMRRHFTVGTLEQIAAVTAGAAAAPPGGRTL